MRFPNIFFFFQFSEKGKATRLDIFVNECKQIHKPSFVLIDFFFFCGFKEFQIRNFLPNVNRLGF